MTLMSQALRFIKSVYIGFRMIQYDKPERFYQGHLSGGAITV